jgi:indole-3-glycerol phosphate synthase
MGLLADILANKKREIEALKREPRQARERQSLDVLGALRRSPGEPVRLIAEIKRKSPSAGTLSQRLTPGQRAVAYAQAGAAMVSVLCDGPFFDGGWAHVAAARGALDALSGDTRSPRAGPGCIPVLAKEFVLDEAQIGEAHDRGADAILLIARIVERAHLVRLAQAARAERLEPVVEVTDESELDAALEACARVVGVNARDLDNLVMDGPRAERVLAAIPRHVIAVHLSGLRGANDITALAKSRADAALVGEALMRLDDPAPLLKEMAAAGR